MILVSPAEPKPLIALLAGKTEERVRTSSLPERYGADFYFHGHAGRTVAIQRKRFPDDFIASADDGRLQREVPLLLQCDIPILVVEGEAEYTTEGELLEQTRWSRSALRNLQRSVSFTGIHVEGTQDMEDTATAIVEIAAYTRKAEHLSLLHRPKMVGSDLWGRKTRRHELEFFLQGIALVGPKLAAAILDDFEDELPLALTCTLERLRQVPGMGPTRAKKFWEFFQEGAK